MTQRRRLPDAIQWHEGMLLSPQHFQQADRRAEALIHYRVRATGPHAWGVRHLSIDPVRLVNGTFQILEIEALLPDGTVVNGSARPDQELTLDLAAISEEVGRGVISVHLAVATAGASEEAGDHLIRYESVEGRAISDMNTGEGELQIPRLRHHVILIGLPLGQPVPEKYSSVTIAQVAVREESFTLSDFVPPTFELTPDSPIVTESRELVSQIREKALFLAEKVRASSALSSSTERGEEENQVHLLASRLPALEALLSAGAPHPHALYLELAGLAGTLAALGTGVVPPLFSAYDHGNLRESFDPVLDFCGRMVESVQQAYQVLPFHYVDGSFQIQLRREWVRDSLVVGAARGADMTEASLVSWLEQAWIGASSKMASIRERRIRGAHRERIETAEELGVVAGRNVLLFRISADPDFIENDGLLVLAHPTEGANRARPAEIVLYVPTE
jgi:type VI secretion system protein ImpJ